MSVPFISQVKRTHDCGELTARDVGKTVVLFGWVQNRRDHGGAVFIDLRDRHGLTQVVFEPDIDPEAHALAGTLRLEWCVGVQGKVVSRGANVNPKMKTGEIEVKATALTVFNRSEPIPFPIEDRSRPPRTSGSPTATSTCAGRPSSTRSSPARG
jgi:aspartyl-tRNA synthetase